MAQPRERTGRLSTAILSRNCADRNTRWFRASRRIFIRLADSASTTTEGRWSTARFHAWRLVVAGLARDENLARESRPQGFQVAVGNVSLMVIVSFFPS